MEDLIKVWPWKKRGVFVLEGEGEPKFLLTVPCAAKILGVAQRTLYYAVKRGIVPARVLRYPTPGRQFFFMELDHLRQAAEHYRLRRAIVIDRLGNLLDWTDEQKALCALEWEGITKEDLEQFFVTGRFPWDRVTARVREQEQV